MLHPALPEGEPDESLASPSRELLERILIQLYLVEVLYMRLVGIEARRMASPDPERELLGESRRIESELRTAQEELETLSSHLRIESSERRQGF